MELSSGEPRRFSPRSMKDGRKGLLGNRNSAGITIHRFPDVAASFAIRNLNVWRNSDVILYRAEPIFFTVADCLHSTFHRYVELGVFPLHWANRPTGDVEAGNRGESINTQKAIAPNADYVGSSSNTSRLSSVLAWNKAIGSTLYSNKLAMTSVPALPTESQITLGGAPLRKLNWRKSLSLETRVKPWSPA